MKCEIISVGTELTTGQNLDTNSQWLSQALAAVGLPTAFHTTVSDDLDDTVRVILTAADRAGLVIITGGLGPTLDDLTRDALAKSLGVGLQFDPESFEAIREMFARRNRPMPERNRVQAMFPEGTTPIPNREGTAPGIWARLGECQIAALPGVPREMKAMFREFVLPRLASQGLTGGVIVERRIRTFGAGESQVEEMLRDVTERGRDPEVGITASDGTISLRIVARAADHTAAEAKIAPVEAVIRERLGSLVYGTDDQELQDVVPILLRAAGLTLATAESVTAGLIAARLGQSPGVSACFRGSVVAYVDSVKVQALDVAAELIERHGVVSGPVAEAMAEGARRRCGADLAVSTTGWAGPGDGGPGQPAGLAFIGLATPNGTISRKFNWFGSRKEVQSRVAKSALNLVRLWLEGRLE